MYLVPSKYPKFISIVLDQRDKVDYYGYVENKIYISVSCSTLMSYRCVHLIKVFYLFIVLYKGHFDNNHVIF